jgi:uncharacterized membrane protein
MPVIILYQYVLSWFTGCRWNASVGEAEGRLAARGEKLKKNRTMTSIKKIMKKNFLFALCI